MNVNRSCGAAIEFLFPFLHSVNVFISVPVAPEPESEATPETQESSPAPEALAPSETAEPPAGSPHTCL